MTDGGAAPPSAVARPGTVLLALVAGQVAIHSCMAGTRMAAPLLALRAGDPAWVVGVLLGLFALAPIALSIPAGRLADRRGYHRPIRLAVGLGIAGGVLAFAAAQAPLAGPWVPARLPLLCLSALLVGGAANTGVIVIMRSAGRMTSDPTGQKRIFSWLGTAPAISNAIGPVLAGTLIDGFGFAAAFAALAVLPVATLACGRWVPPEAPPSLPPSTGRRGSFDLFAAPGFARLLFVNWLLASSWDIHTFLVPVLGHERGFSASAIGLVLGIFAIAVTAIRLVIPALAHRLKEAKVLVVAMLAAGAVFAVYPFAQSAAVMAVCATLLGFALGAVQPMVMTTLMQITPPPRHGEAIALRSMTINLSSALMPVAFGFVGAALGASILFWLMGAAVAAGSVAARKIH